VNILEIETYLLENLSKHTNLFTNYLPAVISGATAVDKRTVKVTTATPHGLANGKLIMMNDGEIKNEIDKFEYLGDGTALVTTKEENDLTFGYQEEIEIAGCDLPEWNKLHTILDVYSSSSFIIEIPDGSTGLPAAGYIWEKREYGVNGIVIVKNAGSLDFEYEIDQNCPDIPVHEVRNLKSIISLRIGTVADEERSIKVFAEEDKYPWLFVIPKEDQVSKDMNEESEAIGLPAAGNEGRIRIMYNFDVVAIIPTDKLGGVDAVIKAEETRDSLLKCLYGKDVQNVNSDVSFRVAYKGSSPMQYDTTTYIRSHGFQATADITFREVDASKPKTVALRQLAFKLSLQNKESVDKLEGNVIL